MRTALPGAAVVGRERERRLLRDAARGAADAVPCAYFVHGEAGLGKTALVRVVADDLASDGVTVLWGAALRFGAVQAAALPLVMALEGWFREAAPAERAEVLASVDGVGRLLPSLGGSPDDVPAAIVMFTLDQLLTRLSLRAPVALVVDDVQWADPVSRDALAYVVAGLAGRRIALLATCRDEEVGLDENGLRAWLADMRRLPFVHELHLPRLSADQTERQLANLLGRPPYPRLAAQVHEKSAGVPYLTELLVQGVDARAERLPPGLPEVLSHAVQGSWQGLTPSTRHVLQVLAVSGAPVAIGDLMDVCAATGQSDHEVERAVTEGTAAAIVERQDGMLWFRHPLLAETLALALTDTDRSACHAAWADALSRSTSSGVDELRRLGMIALHLEQSGQVAQALTASMRAAELAHRTGALKVEAEHLRRAADALESSGVDAEDEVPPGQEDLVALLERAAVALADTGRNVTAVGLLERALARVDPSRDPLTSSRLSILHAETEWFLGRREEEPTDVARRAVELSSRHPDSREYVESLSELSGCLAWEGQVAEARILADRAVEVAERLGDPKALSSAYESRTYSAADAAATDRDSAEALRHARACDDQSLLTFAVTARGNYLDDIGRGDECAALHSDALASALAHGADSHVVFHVGVVARHLLDAGRLNDAAAVVREGLVRTGASHSAACVRMNAWILAVRRGDLDAADQHVARAYELLPSLESRPAVMAPPALAEHLLAHGDPEAALDLLERTLETQSIDPRVADLMTLWASRAAADLADRARDRRDRRAAEVATDRLEDFRSRRQALGTGPVRDVVEGADIDAMAAVSDAERARCAGRATALDWGQAADSCREARLFWEEWLSLLRQAELWATTGRHQADVARLLRAVEQEAAGQGARPMRQRVQAIARVAGVSLDALAALEAPAQAHAAPFASLTPREREVLRYVVAGATYAEIAAELVISEKTVSVHVSNLLRKTETASRRELAALALRTGAAGAS